MVFGRRLAVTSFCLLLGGCALARFRFVFWVRVLLFCRCCFCRCFLFFLRRWMAACGWLRWVSSFVGVWFVAFGVCCLLGVWLMLAFVGWWCVGFVVFRGFLVWLAFAFSVLLPFLPSCPTFAWFGDFGFWPTAAFCLLLTVSSLRCSGVLFPADVWLRSSVFVGRVGLFVAVWATMAGHSCGT